MYNMRDLALNNFDCFYNILCNGTHNLAGFHKYCLHSGCQIYFISAARPLQCGTANSGSFYKEALSP
jgi:hypothetical protein